MLWFLRDEEGQGIVEYALLLGLIAAAVLISMVFLRDHVKQIFSVIANALRRPGDLDD